MNTLPGTRIKDWLITEGPFRKSYNGGQIKTYYNCKCLRCNEIFFVERSNLVHSTSHNCCKRCSRKSHGDTSREGRARLNSIWMNMLSRCHNKNSPNYKWYGGKGVRVCLAWQDYAVFKSWALSMNYRENLTINRKNSDKDYCPENCEWITQTANTSQIWSLKPLCGFQGVS